ncbi:glucose 1-dehydrogenase [Amphritea sp. 2_MG-2023]|uniref:glucose 1-dehydrogenase n=1 Tax=Amphritea TaxID=515417 RepID=UPI001C06FFA8|nr:MULTISPECIES: glucose 1-dehydrogenase [Amphritea]MBU2964655.1 glucose 1-dehydrogenase [Amphritea atlantica]MDO6420403.1 glucose 1-dehydrogenase [Amphritea sp. 2_MG-2023]
MRLHNKVVLVTGGASGIGKAICERFTQEGAKVVVADINHEQGQALTQELGDQALYIDLDVREPTAWAEATQKILTQYGRLDILVNNAGIVIPANVENCTLEDWQYTHAINNDAVFLGCQEAIKTMKVAGGCIINVSSIEGIIGEPKLAAYNASKGAVRIFTKSAALHCAKEDYNIRINSLHPGYVITPLVSKAMKDLSEADAAELEQRVLANIPMKRMAQPEEIASAALFLASDDAQYMTGAELIIDGGYTAH